MGETWQRSVLKDRAKQAFKKNYWSAVLVSLILAIILAAGTSSGGSSDQVDFTDYTQSTGEYGSMISGVARIIGIFSPVQLFTMPFTAILGLFTMSMAVVLAIALFILKIFVFNGLEVGGRGFYIENMYSRPGVERILGAFKSGYIGNVVKITFFRDLYLFLWSLLLVVPGIIKSYEYRMIPYLLAEYPDMPQEEAFRKSKEMMYGNKWNAFVLDLSFIPWTILSTITCGIVGLFYVKPYMDATNAELYATLQMNKKIY